MVQTAEDTRREHMLIEKRSPAVNDDGYVIVILAYPHLLQHLQDGGDGVGHAVVRPVVVVQLMQRPTTLRRANSKAMVNICPCIKV